HSGADHVSVVLAEHFNADPMIAAGAGILQHGSGFVKVAENGIATAIVVQIAQSESAANMDLIAEIRPPKLAQILVLTMPLVVQEDMTLGACSIPGREHDRVAVRYDEVFPAVIVHVNEAGPPTDKVLANCGDSRRLGPEAELGFVLVTLVEVHIQRVQFPLV